MAVRVFRGTASATVVELTGDFDMNNVVEVETAFGAALESDGGDVILDLAGVEFLDSMLLRQIVHAHERAQGLGRRLMIVRPDPVLWRIFTVSGLAAIIPSVASVANAGDRDTGRPV